MTPPPAEPATLPPGKLVISIDLPNGGEESSISSAKATDRGPDAVQRHTPSRHHPPFLPQSHPASAKSEVVAPKQLILFTSGEANDCAVVGTRLAEIPDPDSADSAPGVPGRPHQQFEMENRIFKLPDSSGGGAKRGVRFEDLADGRLPAGGGCAVVNLSGFFARQAVRARPIFSPKFDRHGRRGGGSGWRPARGGDLTSVDLATQPREVLSLATLDVVGNGGRGGGHRSYGAAPKRKKQRKQTSGQQLQQSSSQTSGGGSTGETTALNLLAARGSSPASSSASASAYFSCSDIVKRRESPITLPPPLKIDIDLSEGHLRHQPAHPSVRSCSDDGCSVGPASTRQQQQRQHRHQLSELFGQLQLPKPLEADIAKLRDQKQQEQQQQQQQQQQFRLAEPRMKLSHFSGAKNPNAFYFLNSRMHIHAP